MSWYEHASSKAAYSMSTLFHHISAYVIFLKSSLKLSGVSFTAPARPKSGRNGCSNVYVLSLSGCSFEWHRRATHGGRQQGARIREARVVPDGDEGLLQYFLDTEVQEMEFEVARCRQRITGEFLRFLTKEMGLIRFAATPSLQQQDRLAELQALEKVLLEGVGVPLSGES
eukprot:jgi/Mesen1/7709/ME000405S06994